MREREFFHALDTLPRTPRGVLLPDAAGELRVFPVSVLGRVETRSARHLRTEARARYLELLGHLLERDKGVSVPAETLARQRWRAVARILERRDRIREQLTEARARSGELHRALPAAEHGDREARGRALAEGKAMPPREAPPIAAELEEARQRVHDLEAAAAVVEQDLRQLRQQKGGAWSEHQAHQIEQARRAVLAATAGLEAAVSTLEDEHGLQRWASENADRGSFDPTGGRITHSALAAALDQVRAAVDGLAAGQQRPEPESRPEPAELQKFLARTRASAWGR